MSIFRKATIADWLVGIMVVAVNCWILFSPDSATRTRRDLEQRAREWQSVSPRRLSDPSLLANDLALSGEWITDKHRSRSTFSFVERGDGAYDAQFTTSGCMGGCEFSRTAQIDKSLIALDGAVAEYSGGVYDTLYAIRVDGEEFLLPADAVGRFEQDRELRGNNWKWRVFRRQADKASRNE